MKYYQETQPEMLDYIIRQCIKHNGLDYQHAMDTLHIREDHLVRWRHQAAFIIRAVYPDFPTTRIARALGKQTHNTILHSIKNVAHWYQTDLNYRADFLKLVRSIDGLTVQEFDKMKRLLMYL